MIRSGTSLPSTLLQVASGNFDISRSSIDRIVIHTMAGTWQGANTRFNNAVSKVSAHYGIKIDGSLIQWVDEKHTAYHAGNYAMNQRSIGIEHEDLGKYNDPRPDVLYTSSAKLVRDICLFYNIPIDRQHILKHSEIKATGCPDALDIERIVREAQQGSSMDELTQTRLDRDRNWNLYTGLCSLLGMGPQTDVNISNEYGKKNLQGLRDTSFEEGKNSVPQQPAPAAQSLEKMLGLPDNLYVTGTIVSRR